MLQIVSRYFENLVTLYQKYVEGGYYLLIDYFSKREKEEKVFGRKIGK